MISGHCISRMPISSVFRGIKFIREDFTVCAIIDVPFESRRVDVPFESKRAEVQFESKRVEVPFESRRVEVEC